MSQAVAGVRWPLLPSVTANELEREMDAQWTSENLFAAIDALRSGADEFVFFEGPPTANGQPGIHHVFSRTIKDLICRHRSMRGFHVTRKAGWDTHGLPVEIEVEKQLGISGKQQIEAIGVEEFNQLCRESVWKYKDEWERLSRRIGYQLDYAEPYVTYSNEYVESVWWALATLFERDRLYRGHKILPYCPRCGTALSSHEVAQGYEDVKDPSVYLSLDLVDSAGHTTGRRILVWTTTPWTLVSNVALAVNPALVYAEVRRHKGEESTLLLAESRLPAVLGADWVDRWTLVSKLPGTELAGLRYRRPLDWVPLEGGLHEVIIAEAFVSADDGSGVVHLAPAFGADDYAAGKRQGLSFVQPVTPRGEFPPELPVIGGLFVKSADPLIIAELERRGTLFRAGTIEHSYPHCWRCGTPLLYYARQSWFVRTTAYRDGMLARNARVKWQPPEVGAGRFGEWLENNVDWALSRDRYWGTPLPVWTCGSNAGHVEAIGSYAALAERWGRPLPADFDPHKPFIDSYEWPCRECSGTMTRAAEVIDTWFDSGSMPFAQWHFPFERADVFTRHYPADFIAEGVDQTRGWFYSLLAIAAGLGDALPQNGGAHSAGGTNAVAAPYRSVIVNDLVLDASGVKMSKSRGNAVDPWDVLERHGADAVRLFLVASSQVWMPRRFDEDAIRETASRFLLTLRNVYNGIFATLANFGWEPSSRDPAEAERSPLDRWILSRLGTVAREVDQAFTDLEPTRAARLVMTFVVDDVSNWYVRLSRGRFYDVEDADNRAAFSTLRDVLVTVCRLLAPVCPFLTDWMHRALTTESVHLAPFAASASAIRDAVLEAGMEQIRMLAKLGHAARDEAAVKVRQPLGRLVCVVPSASAAALAELEPLLRSELNVKRVEFLSSGDALVRLEAKPNFRSLGKRFGKRTPLAAQAVAVLSSEALMAFEQGSSIVISIEGESHTLLPDDLSIARKTAGALVVKEEGGYVAALDSAVTPELRSEGIARELVSRVQRLRKESGFSVSDRIRLQVTGNGEVERVVHEHRGYISAEVLASDVAVGGEIAGSPDATPEVDLDGLTVRVALTRVL